MKILFLTNVMPVFPVHHSGGAQRTSLILKALESFGQVDFVFVCPQGVPSRQRWEGMQEARPEVIRVQWQEPKPFRGAHRLGSLLSAPSRESFLESVVEMRRFEVQPTVRDQVRMRVVEGKYDLVVARYIRPAAVAGLFDRDFPVPVLVDIDDLDSEVLRLKLEQKTDFFSRWTRNSRVARLERLIREYVKRTKGVFIANPSDAQRVQDTRGWFLPNIPFHFINGVNEPLPDVSGSQDILFVGNLGYGPNKDGLNYFLQAVWPQVLGEEPCARLRVVGSFLKPEDGSRWAEIENVDVIGFAEDLEAEYARCAFSICPVYWGGGSKIKILESLAYQRTCVISPHAHEAYATSLRHREHLWVGHDDAEFAAGCVTLLQDGALRQRCAQVGRETVCKEFTYESTRRVVSSALAASGFTAVANANV
ncbi:MAG: glycosyltransferase family 4 protein [Verrucomicrobiota bacterium JB022]|nr:glycosyltransferase family 4 protein [Verrucomicrobiota bacterium JB022]